MNLSRAEAAYRGPPGMSRSLPSDPWVANGSTAAVARFDATLSRNTMRSHLALIRPSYTLILGVVLSAAGCGSSNQPATVVATAGVDTARLHASMSVFASDSLRGRFTGSEGAATAARYIAGQLERLGLEPAGDSGYFQRVPIQVTTRSDGRSRFSFYPSVRAWRLLPPEQQLMAVNVVARLPGSDSSNFETVIVGAHYDHLGVRRPVAVVFQ